MLYACRQSESYSCEGRNSDARVTLRRYSDDQAGFQSTVELLVSLVWAAPSAFIMYISTPGFASPGTVREGMEGYAATVGRPRGSDIGSVGVG